MNKKGAKMAPFNLTDVFVSYSVTQTPRNYLSQTCACLWQPSSYSPREPRFLTPQPMLTLFAYWKASRLVWIVFASLSMCLLTAS